VLVAIVLASMIGIGLTNHFACGGTFGGFGESANARLDEACVDRRAWLFALPIATLLALVTIRLLLWRRSRTSG
jgi:phosphate/sulfate permease